MSNHDPANHAYEDTDPATPVKPLGGALVAQGPMAPGPIAMAGGPPRMDVIRGGIDSSSMFHSFRRRWLMAIGLGLLLGSAVAVALFWLFPESSSAVAMFRVSSQQGEVIDQLEDDVNFDIYRRTQQVAVTSPYVLNAALRSPLLEGVKLIQEIPQEERVKWLSEELVVTFAQDSEFMLISLTGSDPPQELSAVVEAVSDAYSQEVVFREKTSRLRPIDILRNSERVLSEEIARKSKAYIALRKEGGMSIHEGADPDTNLMMGEVRDLTKKKLDAESELAQLVTNFQIQKAYLTDPEMQEQRIKQAVANDPGLVEMQNNLVMMAAQMQTSGGGRSAQDSQAQLRTYQQQINAYAQGLQARYENLAEDEPDIALRTLTRDFKTHERRLKLLIAQAQEKIDTLVETLKSKGEINTDIEMREAELEQLRAMQMVIAERMSKWNIERDAPDRITRQPGVEINPSINRLQRYAITGFGGLATFALTCFGIAYLEFHNRRLNNPEQIDEGLGIRVIGALPSLAGRKSLDPRHPVVAQLTESIDSVRTALMHESTTKRRQVVLVTSAATMEGRTTVASQLAASLARAGRRTLLVDGDLRRPSLHSLFDMPLEDGLCEVLRAESDVADVVRPTHAEGLWLMTAGYCDADAVHALATDQAQPIFDKLRADYDFIIIDGAPVLGLADSLLFGQHCDGALLSVLRDVTNVPKIHQSAELLKSVGIRLMGAVVNGVPIKADRRVTHLQVAGPKNPQKQIENVEA